MSETDALLQAINAVSFWIEKLAAAVSINRVETRPRIEAAAKQCDAWARRLRALL
jgi:hypothetical protein